MYSEFDRFKREKNLWINAFYSLPISQQEEILETSKRFHERYELTLETQKGSKVAEFHLPHHGKVYPHVHLVPEQYKNSKEMERDENNLLEGISGWNFAKQMWKTSLSFPNEMDRLRLCFREKNIRG